MSVKLYMTSVTTNREIYIQQSRIRIILEGKNIKYEEIDLAKDKDKRIQMRELAGIPDLIPPQIFNGNKYCGDYQAIDSANEGGLNSLMEFLLLK